MGRYMAHYMNQYYSSIKHVEKCDGCKNNEILQMAIETLNRRMEIDNPDHGQRESVYAGIKAVGFMISTEADRMVTDFQSLNSSGKLLERLWEDSKEVAFTVASQIYEDENQKEVRIVYPGHFSLPIDIAPMHVERVNLALELLNHKFRLEINGRNESE